MIEEITPLNVLRQELRKAAASLFQSHPTTIKDINLKLWSIFGLNYIEEEDKFYPGWIICSYTNSKGKILFAEVVDSKDLSQKKRDLICFTTETLQYIKRNLSDFR